MTKSLASEMSPEVGRYYLVPCMYVQKTAFAWWIPDDGWVPVIGPRHEDAEHLNFPYEHYHIDWRFIPDKQFHRNHGREHHSSVLSNTGGGTLGDAKPALKRRACRREMPDFPSLTMRPASIRIRWQAMEREHACAKLKPGNICPHRGINLTPFIKPDGTVICPGHGLRFDTKTGNLLPHHTQGEQT